MNYRHDNFPSVATPPSIVTRPLRPAASLPPPSGPTPPPAPHSPRRTQTIPLDLPGTALQLLPRYASYPLHAYGPRGAAPLCGVRDWQELVPNTEATCPFCVQMLGADMSPPMQG